MIHIEEKMGNLGERLKKDWVGTLLLIIIALLYIVWINPKYINRCMTRRNE